MLKAVTGQLNISEAFWLMSIIAIPGEFFA